MFRSAKLFLIAVIVLAMVLALVDLFAPMLHVHTLRRHLKREALSLNALVNQQIELNAWRRLRWAEVIAASPVVVDILAASVEEDLPPDQIGWDRETVGPSSRLTATRGNVQAGSLADRVTPGSVQAEGTGSDLPIIALESEEQGVQTIICQPSTESPNSEAPVREGLEVFSYWADFIEHGRSFLQGSSHQPPGVDGDLAAEDDEEPGATDLLVEDPEETLYLDGESPALRGADMPVREQEPVQPEADTPDQDRELAQPEAGTPVRVQEPTEPAADHSSSPVASIRRVVQASRVTFEESHALSLGRVPDLVLLIDEENSLVASVHEDIEPAEWADEALDIDNWEDMEITCPGVSQFEDRAYFTTCAEIEGPGQACIGTVLVGERIDALRFGMDPSGPLRTASAIFGRDGRIISCDLCTPSLRAALERYIETIVESGAFPEWDETFAGMEYDEAEGRIYLLSYGRLPTHAGRFEGPDLALALALGREDVPQSLAALLLRYRHVAAISWKFFLVIAFGAAIVFVGLLIFEIDSRRYRRTIELLEEQITGQPPEHLRSVTIRLEDTKSPSIEGAVRTEQPANQFPPLVQLPQKAPSIGEELEPLTRYRGIYVEYLEARKRCGLASEATPFEPFTDDLERNEAEVKARYRCNTVEFKVVEKDGKVIVVALPVN